MQCWRVPNWAPGTVTKNTVADRLSHLLPPQVMQDMLMDVLRALTSPNLDIRQKTLDLALDLITSRNIDEVRLLSSLVSHSLLKPEP